MIASFSGFGTILSQPAAAGLSQMIFHDGLNILLEDSFDLFLTQCPLNLWTQLFFIDDNRVRQSNLDWYTTFLYQAPKKVLKYFYINFF